MGRGSRKKTLMPRTGPRTHTPPTPDLTVALQWVACCGKCEAIETTPNHHQWAALRDFAEAGWARADGTQLCPDCANTQGSAS